MPFSLLCLQATILLLLQTCSCLPNPANSTNGTTNPQRQGWTSQPNQRGTVDILWACLFTMFLCSWSILCMNVPPQDERRTYRWRRKLYLACLTLLAPEWLFQASLGQWLAARQSVKQFHAAGHSWWTMKHAFFANMGGFILIAKDESVPFVDGERADWTPFPVNALQLHYLVEQGYLKLPKISKRFIIENDKVDGTIRVLTMCQILWFVINVVARRVQNLPITCFELTTAAFIYCAIGITFCWAHKPADLVIPRYIRTEFSIQRILLDAGDKAREPYLRTPLEFIDYEESPMSLYFQHCVHILHHMKLPIGRRIRPIPAIENTLNLPVPDRSMRVVICLSFFYIALFFSAWNFSFPSSLEQTLWRSASVVMITVLPAFYVTTQWAFLWYPRMRERLQYTSSDRWNLMDAPRQRHWPGRDARGPAAWRVRALLGSCKNNSPSKHAKLDIPLKAIFTMYFFAVLYCHARAYIYVADVIELRSLPPLAYQCVSWSNFFPHV